MAYIVAMTFPGGGGGHWRALLFVGDTSFPLSMCYTLSLCFVGATGGLGNFWGYLGSGGLGNLWGHMGEWRP